MSFTLLCMTASPFVRSCARAHISHADINNFCKNSSQASSCSKRRLSARVACREHMSEHPGISSRGREASGHTTLKPGAGSPGAVITADSQHNGACKCSRLVSQYDWLVKRWGTIAMRNGSHAFARRLALLLTRLVALRPGPVVHHGKLTVFLGVRVSECEPAGLALNYGRQEIDRSIEVSLSARSARARTRVHARFTRMHARVTRPP